MCPCKGCLKRKLNCHSSCQEYLEWKAGLQVNKQDEHLSYLKDKRTRAIRKAKHNGKC